MKTQVLAFITAGMLAAAGAAHAQMAAPPGGDTPNLTDVDAGGLTPNTLVSPVALSDTNDGDDQQSGDVVDAAGTEPEGTLGTAGVAAVGAAVTVGLVAGAGSSGGSSKNTGGTGTTGTN